MIWVVPSRHPLIRALALLSLLTLAGCPVEREAAIGVTVSIEVGTSSTHVVVSAVGGEVTKKTRCIPIAGQRFLDVGVAQGDLSDTVSLSAVGSSASLLIPCTTARRVGLS